MRRPLTRIVVLATTLGAFTEQEALAQAGFDRECLAPAPPYSERTDWYDAEGLFVHDTSARSSSSLADRFAGAYRLIVVTTEGALEKEIVEYRMSLGAPNRSQQEQIDRLPAVASGRLQVPLVAKLDYERGATGQQRMARRPYRDFSGQVNFEYWPNSGKIGFDVGLGIDTGTLFQVTDVSEQGTFRGRWEDGGMVAIQMQTLILPILEHVRGYFCALPVAK